MPYQQQIVDPFGGVKEGINALATVVQLGQRDRALDQGQQRVDIEQGKADQEKALLPFKYMQAKMEAGLQFLPGLQQEKYGDFYKWSTEVPIDAKNGLGTIPKELLPDPSVVASWTPEEYVKNKQNWFVKGKDLAERDTAQFKAELEKGLQQQRAANTQSELTQRGNIIAAQDARILNQQTNQGALEDKRHANAMALEDARFKRESLNPGGGDKLDVIRTPEGNYSLGQIQSLWKNMNRFPDEIDLQILKVQNPAKYAETIQRMQETESKFPAFLESVRQNGLPKGGQPVAPAAGAVQGNARTYNPATRKFE